MCCIIALLLLIGPRTAMIVLWFMDYFKGIFETTIWPILGFIFMPCTTLAYAFTMHENNRQIDGGWVILMIIAALFDLGMYSSSSRSRSS